MPIASRSQILDASTNDCPLAYPLLKTAKTILPQLAHSVTTDMGNCMSTLDCQAKAHSDTINKEIENESKKLRKEIKILLLDALADSYPDLYLVQGRCC